MNDKNDAPSCNLHDKNNTESKYTVINSFVNLVYYLTFSTNADLDVKERTVKPP